MQRDIKSENKPKPKKENKPDETSGFNVEGHLKIYDPESNEIFRNIRG